MIFYTSGTGNSMWVAKELARLLGDSTIDIGKTLKGTKHPYFESLNDDKLILVMPVHSWGPALMGIRFIQNCQLNWSSAWCVFVCGDMCGNADKVIARKLKQHGIVLSGAFSVQMPNNYILIKGFGTDPDDLANAKLAAAANRVRAVAKAIDEKRADKSLYVRGSLPVLKTGVVYPLFTSLAVKHVKFRATDACIACRLCVNVCPTGNITMYDSLPHWDNDCVQCLACIHRCPERAIEYGNVTKTMGRYVHPDLRRKEE